MVKVRLLIVSWRLRYLLGTIHANLHSAFSGCLPSDTDNRQVLDQLPVERARGITVKAQVYHLSLIFSISLSLIFSISLSLIFYLCLPIGDYKRLYQKVGALIIESGLVHETRLCGGAEVQSYSYSFENFSSSINQEHARDYIQAKTSVAGASPCARHRQRNMADSQNGRGS